MVPGGTYGNARSAVTSRRVGEVIGAFGEVVIGGECLSPPTKNAGLEIPDTDQKNGRSPGGDAAVDRKRVRSTRGS